MRLGKYSIYLLICFFLNLEQSFCQTLSSQDIENLEDLPSTYEEEDFIEDDTENNEILKKIKYKEEKATNNNEVVTVEIRALDKITAIISTLHIKIGEEKKFGNLNIKPLKCKISDMDQSPDTIAYLQVTDVSIKNNDQVYVFNGWIFASSPSLKPIDHAIYDLWLVGCSNI